MSGDDTLRDRVERGLFDRVEVRHDGEEVTVFGWATVEVHEQTRFQAGSQETFRGTVRIEAGDGGIGVPEAVAPFLADAILDTYSIDVEDHGIDVIDPASEEVDLL